MVRFEAIFSTLLTHFCVQSNVMQVFEKITHSLNRDGIPQTIEQAFLDRNANESKMAK